MKGKAVFFALLGTAAFVTAGCSSSKEGIPENSSSGGSASTGGSSSGGSSSTTGGSGNATGGSTNATGGNASASGGTTSATGGTTTATGGSTPATGGTSPATGGTTASGGITATGGTTTTGGTTASGGDTAAGGTTASGGDTAAGGTTASGGDTAAGGTTASGGDTAAGGTTATGGTGGSGGMTPQTCAKKALPAGKVDFLNFSAFTATGAWGTDAGTDAGLTGGTSKYNDSASTITYDGTAGNLHITASIAASGYVGLTFWFGPCVDLSPYTGVTLSIGGTGTGIVTTFKVQTNTDYPIEPANSKGACAYVTSKWSECLSPLSTVTVPATPGVIQIPWASFAGGKPTAGVGDASDVVGYQIQFECQQASACTLDVTLDDVGVYPDLRDAGA